jgi:two-component system cell cycle response regulator DivK
MKPKVLIADDDPDNRAIAQDALEMAGYDVVLACDGQKAFEKIVSEKPDVVLLDMSMPKLDGWEVAKRVRETKALAHTPLIAFTAHALVGEELKAKAAGCDDYLTKPCMPKDLVLRVAVWIGRARSPASEAA